MLRGLLSSHNQDADAVATLILEGATVAEAEMLREKCGDFIAKRKREREAPLLSFAQSLIPSLRAIENATRVHGAVSYWCDGYLPHYWKYDENYPKGWIKGDPLPTDFFETPITLETHRKIVSFLRHLELE